MFDLPFLEFKDGHGQVYGSFSSGWATELENLGGSEPPVLVRAIGCDEWVPYAKVGRLRPPKGFQRPDDATMRSEAYRLLHVIAGDRVRRERGALPPAPVAWDADFPANVGFARQSHEVYTDARLGLRVGYATSCDTHASVYEYPIQRAERTEIALRTEWARQIESARADVAKLAALGAFRSFKWISGAPVAESPEASGPQFVLAGFSHSRRPISRAWGEDVTFAEWIALAPVGLKWLKIRYTYEACLAAFEGPRFTRFLGSAWRAFDTVQERAEMLPAASTGTARDDLDLTDDPEWILKVVGEVVTGTVEPVNFIQGKPRWLQVHPL